jgi:hypothetical protein
MKPRIVSWDVRGLNEGYKYLKVRNLLWNWKVDVVCLKETKLDSMSCSIVHRLWGCSHVDWSCLDSSGASRGILILWDKRVVEEVDECEGSTPCLFPLGTLLIIPLGPLQVFMALIRIRIEGFYGMSWLACTVGGTCSGVLWGF